MKVRIGKYINWVGPYQLVEKLFFWQEKYPNDTLAQRWDYQLSDRIGDWLANTWVNDFCQWVHAKRQRTVKIQIDCWDTWSADHTLSMIVVPMLKQLQDTKHGAPVVDVEDVPKNLRPTKLQFEKYKTTGDVDPKFFKRWDWVLNEMIWAHEQIINNDSDGQFYDHSEANDPNDDFTIQVSKIKVDKKGLKAHHDRINNGLRLFGKYYRALWD